MSIALFPGGFTPLQMSILRSPTFARMNTPMTNILGPDGLTWAQAFPIITDKYGKIILSSEDSSGNHAFTFSNNYGTTWADNTGITGNGSSGSVEGFIIRSALAYNDYDDVLWALHVASGGNGGAFIRRYTFTRDGSNNILTIVRDQSSTLVLEDSADSLCEKPIIFWLNDPIYGSHGALVALWEITDATTGTAHASMRVLSNTSADSVAGNWRTLGGSATSDTNATTATQSVACSNIAPNYGTKLCIAAARKRTGTHANDIYLFWQDASTTGKVRGRRLQQNAGTGWFTTFTTAVDVSLNVRAGTTTIRQLWEVLAKPVEDITNDCMYIAFANYKSNTAGDTWSIGGLSNADAALTVTDVYSCGGTFTPSLYALTGDIAYDARTNSLIVLYIHSGGVGFNGAYAKVYRNGVLQGSEKTLFTTADVDIPLIYVHPTTNDDRINSKLFIAFRDTRNQAAPYYGWWGTVDISVITILTDHTTNVLTDHTGNTFITA